MQLTHYTDYSLRVLIFLALQEELTSTENRIAYSRQGYNDSVYFFNNKIQMFPSNIIAGMFSFKESEFFELEELPGSAAVVGLGVIGLEIGQAFKRLGVEVTGAIAVLEATLA